MDREVAAETRTRILRNVLRGWNAYREGRPGLALVFLRKAAIDLNNLIRKIEKEEKA